jgi:hypothetical protein
VNPQNFIVSARMFALILRWDTSGAVSLSPSQPARCPCTSGALAQSLPTLLDEVDFHAMEWVRSAADLNARPDPIRF